MTAPEKVPSTFHYFREKVPLARLGLTLEGWGDPYVWDREQQEQYLLHSLRKPDNSTVGFPDPSGLD